MRKIFFQNGSVQRADSADVVSGKFIQDRLDLHTVLSDNAEIISSRFVVPVVFHVQSAEFSKSVGGEKYFGEPVVGKHYFGPMHHRSKDEFEAVISERQSIPVLYDDASVGKIRAEVFFKHNESFVVADY